MLPDHALLAEALRHLGGPTLSVVATKGAVPRRPGLYAVHGGRAVWDELGLGQPADARPLYVGKSERNLASRDIGTHFSTGKSGSSTLRRSLAGLLADELALEGRPRDPAKPERFANFGLEASGDERLTGWMVTHLRLAVWPSPDGAILDQVETAVLEQLLPPLNVAKVSTPWRDTVQAGRRRLAGQAEAWATGIADWPESQECPQRRRFASVCVCNTLTRVSEPFDLDLLDDEDPFEIDGQVAHLFKHPRLGVEDIDDVWQSDPIFYPAKPPAHWLMVAEVAGVVLVVPLAPSDSDDHTKCRPIGCYVAANHLVTRYREDR